MHILSNKELMEFYGGGVKLAVGVGAVLTFLWSVVYGFIHPTKCNK